MLLALIKNSSSLVLIFPPVARIFVLETEFKTSSNDKLYLNKSSSVIEISISSSGKPETEICEIPSMFLMSFSIFFEIFFNDFRSIFLPVRENITVGCCSSILVITIGSRSTGNDGTLSTAFFTSNNIASSSKSSSVSTNMVPEFSLEVDVTLTIPVTPFKFSSILYITPSSTS